MIGIKNTSQSIPVHAPMAKTPQNKNIILIPCFFEPHVHFSCTWDQGEDKKPESTFLFLHTFICLHSLILLEKSLDIFYKRTGAITNVLSEFSGELVESAILMFGQYSVCLRGSILM